MSWPAAPDSVVDRTRRDRPDATARHQQWAAPTDKAPGKKSESDKPPKRPAQKKADAKKTTAKNDTKRSDAKAPDTKPKQSPVIAAEKDAKGIYTLKPPPSE